MGWGLSASAAPCAQVSPCHPDCFGNPVWCKQCILSSHQLLPFHRIQEWTGKYFSKSSLFEQGFIIYLGHTMANPAQKRETQWEDVSTVGVEEVVQEVHEDGFLEHRWLGYHGHCSQQWHIPNTASNGVLTRNLHLITFSFSDIVYFYPSLVRPKTAFTFDVLNHFIWIQWNARLRLSVFCRSFNSSQIIQLWHLFLLVITVHHWPAH